MTRDATATGVAQATALVVIGAAGSTPDTSPGSGSSGSTGRPAVDLVWQEERSEAGGQGGGGQLALRVGASLAALTLIALGGIWLWRVRGAF